MSEWLNISDAARTPGEEIVVRFKQSISNVLPKLLGLSVHQICQWDGEGRLWLRGYVVPEEYLEGYVPLPKSDGMDLKAAVSELRAVKAEWPYEKKSS